MPIYEYECSGENKHRFEKWQSIKDDALTECPDCGAAVRKIFHPAGIIFKGSGWYITDSRKSSGSEAKSESPGAKSETKSESKETKSESKETKSETKETKSSSDGAKSE